MARGLRFKVENPYQRATNVQARSAETMAQQMKEQETKTEVDKTPGGAAMSAVTGAMGVATIGEMAGIGAAAGPGGMAAGAILGLGMYLFS